MRRRDFLASAVGAVALPAQLRALSQPPLPGIRFGYAAITWDGNDRQAIDDISTLGFRGIQLRTSALTEWGDRPEQLKHLLVSHDLAFVALSSGAVRIDPAHEAEDLEIHLRNAKFLRAAGGLYLQVVDERPRGRAPANDDYLRMGRLLTELGRRTADLGVQLGYHNHMGNLGQAPEEVARVLDAADPRFVKLELDTAHYAQAGGDPALAVEQYRDRLLFLHLKDLESPVPGQGTDTYRFVELGRGRIDLPKVLAALAKIPFSGWAVVELDRVPDPGRTPRESGLISRRYLESQGFRLSP